MNKYFYDLHIHSCLSPCGDNDSTPNNIAGMGELNGLNIMALTDHNTSKNCPAFFEAAKKHGIIPIAGMELTTAEEIHFICLFEELETALQFDEIVSSRLIPIKNNVDIFGEQLILNKDDEIIGSYDYLLSNATDISLEEAHKIVHSLGGIIYPAHIDRSSYGILSVLGFLPTTPKFSVLEVAQKDKLPEITQKIGLNNEKIIFSSDAHNLWDINEKENFFELDDEPYSSAYVRKKLFEFLR